ncbi:hypothetical protein FHW14_003731, partial [Terracoccus luteus]|nr:hypothetical protein [Terracoccus luteus]
MRLYYLGTPSFWVSPLLLRRTVFGADVVSTTLENEAIATVENEATQTDWMGDLSGRLGS